MGEVIAYDDAKFVLAIRCPLFSECPMGASIAIDGVCLTVSHLDNQRINVVGFDLGEETRNITLLANKKPFDLVNVEFSLRMGESVDGHMVQGHVEGIARLISQDTVNAGQILQFSLPTPLQPFVIPKGSIAINGVSLTVNMVEPSSFFVCLVPFTVRNTSFSHIMLGDLVHIETDIVGRYLYNFAKNTLKDTAL